MTYRISISQDTDKTGHVCQQMYSCNCKRLPQRLMKQKKVRTWLSLRLAWLVPVSTRRTHCRRWHSCMFVILATMLYILVTMSASLFVWHVWRHSRLRRLNYQHVVYIIMPVNNNKYYLLLLLLTTTTTTTKSTTALCLSNRYDTIMARDVPNIRFVFASVPNNGPNSVFVFGWIV